MLYLSEQEYSGLSSERPLRGCADSKEAIVRGGAETCV